MDVSAVAPSPPLAVSRIGADGSRRRDVRGGIVTDDPQTVFQLPADEAFDSATPVAVDAVTEAALARLKPVNGLALIEVLHRYADAD